MYQTVVCKYERDPVMIDFFLNIIMGEGVVLLCAGIQKKIQSLTCFPVEHSNQTVWLMTFILVRTYKVTKDMLPP